MRWWFCLISALFFSTNVWAQSFTAKINRNPVPLGETFVLTLEYDAKPADGQRPDLEALKDSFTVHTVSTYSSSSYTNGLSKLIHQWNVTLSPIDPGDITIPAIEFNGLETKPIVLRVPDEPISAANSGTKFAINRVIDNSSPFVQEQIHYKLTITAAEEIHGQEPSFMLSDPNEWIIKILGPAKMHKEVINGVEVMQIVLQYALFPQKSGALTIPEVKFEGYYEDPDAKPMLDPLQGMFSANGFGFASIMSTPVYLTAKPIEINVKKIPETNNGNWWLPAKSVKISSDWDNMVPEFKAGDVVTRKIYLSAAGAIDTQMPELDFAEAVGIKQYPEKPTFSSSVDGDNVVSLMSLNNVYIMQKPGNVTIPEITVNWYNTDTGKSEQAILPAIEANVAKGDWVEDSTVDSTPAITDDIEQNLPTAHNRNPWVYITMAFILGILISYMLFRPIPTKPEKNKKETVPDFSKAAKSNDIKAIRDHVLAWGKEFYGQENIANLNDVAKATKDDDFKTQLGLLNTALYSHSKTNFNPEELQNAFERVSKKNKKKPKKEKLLPDLYR